MLIACLPVSIVLNLDPRIVSHCRAGYTRLIRIVDFQSRYVELQSRLTTTCSTLSNEPCPDLSTEDIIVPTPFQAVENAIEVEVERANKYAVEQNRSAVSMRETARQQQQIQQGMQRATQAQQQQFQQMQMQLQQQQASHQMQQQHQQHLNDLDDPMEDDANAPPLLPSIEQGLDERAAFKKEHVEREAATAPSSFSSSSSAAAAASSAAIVEHHMTDASQVDHSLPAIPAASPASTRPVVRDAEPDLPPDFGLSMPKYDSLLSPLLPLQKAHAKSAGKRSHADLNCMTTKAFENDIKSRTAGHAAPIPLPSNEVILRVAVYHPTNHSKTQEFIVCGSAVLTTLRDRIYCLHDHTLNGPHTPSGFFFIEGKFYNDMRDRRAINYADTIMDWIKADGRYNHPGLAHFDESDMHTTTFSQLSIRLGAHYLYRHQGACDHVLIFSQLRMAHPHDVQNVLAYPLKP
ncbi:MAG: hypothetical protein Q7T57_01880, partial [Dehalococcoidales bacterium]|nr:hypothetical protein [Dehalococcoidales bacterium]